MAAGERAAEYDGLQVGTGRHSDSSFCEHGCAVVILFFLCRRSSNVGRVALFCIAKNTHAFRRFSCFLAEKKT